MNLKYKKINTPEGLKELADFEETLFPTYPNPLSIYEKYVNDDGAKNIFYIVLDDNGETVGILAVNIYKDFRTTNHLIGKEVSFKNTMFLCSIAISKDKRRMGLGKQLMEKANEIAIENNVDTGTLSVETENVALQMYLKHGYKKDHIWKTRMFMIKQYKLV